MQRHTLDSRSTVGKCGKASAQIRHAVLTNPDLKI